MGITTATTGAGRMEFNDFMVALAEISTKVYPDLEGDEALAKIMEEKVIPLAGRMEFNDFMVALANYHNH
eukprot:CAMPEP_0205833610 /NCGR_PEP_ID=MMETSP0206-20130828/50114_1 /ASSEMBLY_ACC=CAM_ASM_000279 /TAXON_ID=36767 /ORGANISM="Euplotes focardii, Strain TN1" /LENGTH=69 /DNA_ID=CAMNT_0053140155 /DNA_START=120 /DNA_END=329 /DNA_ORIENTATION=+